MSLNAKQAPTESLLTPSFGTMKGQASLENWFKKPKAAPSDDEDGEKATLPPESGSDDELLVSPKKKSKPSTSKASKKHSGSLTDEDTRSPLSPTSFLMASTTPKRSANVKAKIARLSRKERGEEEDEEDDTGINKNKTHADDLKLPPLSGMPDIFRDIVKRNKRLADVADVFEDRKLRVATMCSGTESPLLALQLITEAMHDILGKTLQVEHVFSCEIEPFKQAYIERNFHPPILFRDVTELGGTEATTAYGSLVSVPGNVDILIAGTSCVDYSTLNTQKKGIDAGGESGNTFYGMLQWVKNHQPAIVILENVCGAPWDEIVKEFKGINYSAKHSRIDTKNFYIPHTRTRGYLVAVSQPKSSIPERWAQDMKTVMPRPASVTLDAFLLPTDDPRIHSSRQRLAAETKQSAERRRKEVDWARCEQRHTRSRAEEKLGNKRPLTKWEEGGGFSFLDYIWEDWGGDAVPRVKDLMDISHLRGAKIGIDSSYKTTVWNLSQNVDRQIGSGRLGIAPCLTPTMIAYITNRGGPLVGLEALGLQGLPVDRLLLTRETQDQLADLAGNAMSTTVVGSCMIQALILSLDILKKSRRTNDVSMDVDRDNSTIVERNLLTATLDDRIVGIENLVQHPLNFAPIKSLSLDSLVREAQASRRLCICEGRISVIDRAMQECADCETTACIKCGTRPEHSYREISFKSPRPLPLSFAEQAKKSLPMSLAFKSSSTDKLLENLKNDSSCPVNQAIWEPWKEAVIQATQRELNFVELRRQEIWVAIYESPAARLELHLHPKQVEWRLFAIPDASLNANSPVRATLASPVARMICKKGLVEDSWEYSLPVNKVVKMVIRGVGEGEDALEDSWEKSLGLLEDKFRDKRVWKALRISLKDSSDKQFLDRDVTGEYIYLPKCGAASSSLHKRVKDARGGAVDNTLPAIYFFLDPTRCREETWDSFVFSTSIRRYEYTESRPIIAHLQPNWRQSDKRETIVDCNISCEWKQATGLKCQPTASQGATYSIPSGTLNIVVNNSTCAKASALLACNVPLGDEPSALWPSNQWLEIDKLREREYLRLMAWILQRIRDVSHDAQWTLAQLDSSDGSCSCERCAPTPPRIMWYKKDKGRSNEVRAIEDSRQAGPYERALKARPSAFQIHVKYSPQSKRGEIVIGINPATLVHQAASQLPKRAGIIEGSWRLDTNYVPIPLLSKPNFVIPSNRHDQPARQPKGFKLKLRPEQLRSLSWMQSQEDTVEPFVEEEICEGVSEHLGWRLEGRARRPVLIRGGVLADQVGYGKTAIMLGLISTRPGKESAKKEECPAGKIPVKGTCVIVPAHLVLQWKDEVTKFIEKIEGRSPKVVTLHQGTDINSTSIQEIQEADLIIVASSMPNSEHYWDNLGAFSGVVLPSKAGRYFNARLKETHIALSAQVQRLQEPDGVKAVEKVIKKAHANAHTQESFVQPKRLKGRAYAEANEDKAKDLQILNVAPVKEDNVVAAPKDTLGEPSATSKHPEAKRVFEGVFVPSLSSVNKKSEKSKLKVKRGAITYIESSDSEADITSKPTKRGKAATDEEEDDYKGDTTDDSSSEVDDESSSSNESRSGLDEESDPPPTKKAKPKGRPPVKAPAASRPQKRKAMEDDKEQEGDHAEGPPQKKAKVVKEKKSRATMDPWRLKTDEVQGDWRKMKAPPLDMFHFHRLVVDEFTYTKKEHVSHAIVTQISATCRWVMSGTPPTGDFASVKGIAAFLGLHLGVDDDAEGTTEEVKSRIQDKTAAEAFHSFRDVRSTHWHLSRQAVAQKFLDKFVRQNIAEIEDIPLVEQIRSVTFTASERALYLELEHYLRAQELKMKKTGKSQSDRVRRLNKALGDSKTPEEALLKTASHFDCQADAALNSTKACDIIVKQREAERDKCIRELRRKLIASFKMERKLAKTRSRKDTKDANVRSHFKQTLDEWSHGGDKDAETKQILEELVAEAKDPDAVAEPESASDDDDGQTKGKGKKATKVKPVKKGKAEPEEENMDDTEMEWAHRENAHELRALAKELGGRVRSLRFFQCVRSFQEDISLLHDCPKCGRPRLTREEVSILSSCGHVGCKSCVLNCATNESCVQQINGLCKVPASSLFVVPADTLGQDKDADAQGRHWGQKLEDIVALILALPKNERILIFVQFNDLTKKVAEALAAHSVQYSEIRGTPLQQAKVLQEFQNPKSKSRILLLNLGDESASGGNLTVANHAIFISPLLAKNQFEYNQAETQAIGRIRRFGQVKDANIYRFVTRNTIDEEMYAARGQSLGDLSKKIQKVRIGGSSTDAEVPSVSDITYMEVDD